MHLHLEVIEFYLHYNSLIPNFYSRFVGPALDNLCEELKLNKKKFIQNDNIEALPVKKSISLKNIYYHYPNTNQTSLTNISLEIFNCSTVGLVGATGSGNTTTADIILGLLDPQKGELKVACVDRIRSFPILYDKKKNQFLYGKKIQQIKFKKKDLENDALKLFSLSGFTPNNLTLKKNLFQLEAGDLILLNKKKLEKVNILTNRKKRFSCDNYRITYLLTLTG